jgi:hypothetical protein
VTAFTGASTDSQPDVSTEGSGDPVGPDATGPALFGLCTAWEGHAEPRELEWWSQRARGGKPLASRWRVRLRVCHDLVQFDA